MYLEDHIASNKPEAAAGVSSGVVKEAVAEIEGLCCRAGLLG